MLHSYLTRESAINAVGNIMMFADDMQKTYSRHGIDLSSDVGRQNIILSPAQEHFFADVISKAVGACRNDGRTGEPDIIITALNNRELECKVVCKGKGGGWHLQADRTSLVTGKSLDFLYLLFDREYKNVGVLLFKDLVYDDFKVPSPGSRGKSRMDKKHAFKKCIPLVGGFFDRREEYMQRYTTEIKMANQPHDLKRAKEKFALWEKKEPQISITLESIDEIRT
jgi:hypothetical protein